MKLPGARKTKTGAWSTSASVLDDLAEEGHLLPTRILEWRQISKLRSTYTDLLPTFVNPDTGRVHTNYALASTTTGGSPHSTPICRTSRSGPRRAARSGAPLSRRPAPSSYRPIIRKSNCGSSPKLPISKRLNARSGRDDIHALTASEMFGVPVKGMPGEVRRRAKAINFGIIYGISAFGLANQLGIPREEAGAYIKKYFERFPGIRAFMDASKEACGKTAM